MTAEDRDLHWRVIAAVAVGLIVAATTYLTAYWTGRDPRLFHEVAAETNGLLHRIHDAIEDHRRSTGRLPASLADAKELKEHFAVDDTGRLDDYWGHPIEYRVEGDGFTLVSYGRDGKPGGDGENADIDLDHPPKPAGLGEFFDDPRTIGILATSVLSGGCAGIICLLPRRRPQKRLPTRIAVLVVWSASIGAAVIGSVIVGTIIAVLHIYTGH